MAEFFTTPTGSWSTISVLNSVANEPNLATTFRFYPLDPARSGQLFADQAVWSYASLGVIVVELLRLWRLGEVLTPRRYKAVLALIGVIKTDGKFDNRRVYIAAVFLHIRFLLDGCDAPVGSLLEQYGPDSESFQRLHPPQQESMSRYLAAQGDWESAPMLRKYRDLMAVAPRCFGSGNQNLWYFTVIVTRLVDGLEPEARGSGTTAAVKLRDEIFRVECNAPIRPRGDRAVVMNAASNEALQQLYMDSGFLEMDLCIDDMDIIKETGDCDILIQDMLFDELY